MRNISLRSLRQVLVSVQEDAASRRQVSAASHRRFDEVKHTLRVAGEDGGELGIECAHPGRLLDLLLRENPFIRTCFEEAWRVSPSSHARPWRLLIGWDEFVPGNKLAIKNTRKTMVLSFSFLELRERLGSDAAWVTPLAVRTSVIQQARGKWSAILRAFLRVLLLGAEGFSTSGFPVTVAGTTQLLFATVHTLLSDGDGLRQALEWLGAAALKPCFRHWNVFSEESDLAERCTSSRLGGQQCTPTPTLSRPRASRNCKVMVGVSVDDQLPKGSTSQQPAQIRHCSALGRVRICAKQQQY